MIRKNTNFTSKLTKYLDKRARPQQNSVVYLESSGSFVGGGSTTVSRTVFTSATTIVVMHDLGKLPFVQIAFDNGDGTWEGDKHIMYTVKHNSVNQLTITLGVAGSGTIICLA